MDVTITTTTTTRRPAQQELRPPGFRGTTHDLWRVWGPAQQELRPPGFRGTTHDLWRVWGMRISRLVFVSTFVLPISCFVLLWPVVLAAEETVVGMTARLDDIIIKGDELEAKPIVDHRQPIVLRVEKAIRHGSDFRYQLVYYGLAPGEYNLIDYMQRKDGSSTEQVPALPVTIVGVLPPGQVRPNELSISRSPWIGGYRLAVGIGGLVWFVGLIVLLRMTRRRQIAGDAVADRPLTLAERLQPLVEAAASGTIQDDQRADLERLLLAHWRKKLQVQDLPPAKAMAAMKADANAGPLLNQLESWLHHPRPNEKIDIAALLEPYRVVGD